jgi:isopenicillin N synthase-like dioxygenase
MYLDKEGQVVSACPDEAAGLYIQARSGERVQVRLPPDACGFQIGETSQIQSGGLLQATPHAVLPARGQYDDGRRITREAFAVFLEPEFDAPLAIPEGKTVQDCQAEHANLPASILPVQTRWKSGQTFGDFHVATVTAFATD